MKQSSRLWFKCYHFIRALSCMEQSLKKRVGLIIANERGQEDYFHHFHRASQARSTKRRHVRDFSVGDKHFSLRTKLIFLCSYLTYPLNANCTFTLEGKAKLFPPGFKRIVPGDCMFSTLYAQATKRPAPALITQPSER